MTDTFMSLAESNILTEHYKECEQNLLEQKSKPTSWISAVEKDLWDEHIKKCRDDFEQTLMWGLPMTPQPQREDHFVKFALVRIGEEHRTIGVDNRTMVGYQADESGYAWKLPLEVLPYDEFYRWARMMDM